MFEVFYSSKIASYFSHITVGSNIKSNIQFSHHIYAYLYIYMCNKKIQVCILLFFVCSLKLWYYLRNKKIIINNGSYSPFSIQEILFFWIALYSLENCQCTTGFIAGSMAQQKPFQKRKTRARTLLTCDAG